MKRPLAHSAQIEALRILFDRGAFLRIANHSKGLIGKMRGYECELDAQGNYIFDKMPNGATKIRGAMKDRVRSPWAQIMHHIETDDLGYVLLYQPCTLGILILDFDPMLEYRLDAMSRLIGCLPYRTFESSGKWKPAQGSKPAGRGGHATWRVDPATATESAHIRYFASEYDGEHYGEMFCGHPGFGVIVWDAVALVETMELDAFEAIDPCIIPTAKIELPTKNADGTWAGGEGSRHDAAMVEIASLAGRARSEDEYQTGMADIEERFVASFDDSDRKARDIAAEWQRMADKGRTYRKRDTRRIDTSQLMPGSRLLGAAIESNAPVAPVTRIKRKARRRPAGKLD